VPAPVGSLILRICPLLLVLVIDEQLSDEELKQFLSSARKLLDS
jgi:hypothetical protein